MTKVKEGGGIKKKDPNSVKADINEEKQKRIKRRLEEQETQGQTNVNYAYDHYR